MVNATTIVRSVSSQELPPEALSWVPLSGALSSRSTSGFRSNIKLSIFFGTSDDRWIARSEEHTSELQSLMRISYAVFCLKKKNKQPNYIKNIPITNTVTSHLTLTTHYTTHINYQTTLPNH